MSMSESALHTHLLAAAVAYRRSRYGRSVRTLVLDASGRFGMTGDYLRVDEAKASCRSSLAKTTGKRAFAYGGELADVVHELKDGSSGPELVPLQLADAQADGSPRTRPSALAR